MARKSNPSPKKKAEPLPFRQKLLLNQWLMWQLGIDPLADYGAREGKHGERIRIRPFHKLTELLQDTRLEGRDNDNLHRFYTALVNSSLYWDQERAQTNTPTPLTRQQLLRYEENIGRHTDAINAKRSRPIVWKYYQWLSLLFVEIYLDQYFNNRLGLWQSLDNYRQKFNSHYRDIPDLPAYGQEDLNKVCLQLATGSGKTLLMHVNLKQYAHYAKLVGKHNELSRAILLTPNERLSEQHAAEFEESAIRADLYSKEGHNLFTSAQGLQRVDILEVTKLRDEEGPDTLATRSLGDQNLLLVDEGHRGLSGKEDAAWISRRNQLCEKGFAFEYSATFQEAVVGTDFEDSYAKNILFDYSYRWFYEDGFGKDYQILNLPRTLEEQQTLYLTACLLKYYQQLRVYEESLNAWKPFNLEKPLWVFVGSTVKGKATKKGEFEEGKETVSDVAQILFFLADFLANKQAAAQRIEQVLRGTGRDTGLLDEAGQDIFEGGFHYLNQTGEKAEVLYQDILRRLFQTAAGGVLSLERIKGDSGEVVLRVEGAQTEFGLINVGEAKALTDYLEQQIVGNGINLRVKESNFAESQFASVKYSTSPVNVLVGSKKFVEGWDCWRVSTMGLMHVGKKEGSQIIQLFGRGVRLKGYQWSLKRSNRMAKEVGQQPANIHCWKP